MHAFFEDRWAAADEPAAWVFSDLRDRVDGDWPSLLAALDAAHASGHWAVVALDYELGYVLEPKAGVAPTVRVGTVWTFATRQELTGAQRIAWWEAECAKRLAASCPSAIYGVSADWSEAEHSAAVRSIHQYIQAGDCYQVNLTFPLRFRYVGHPLDLYDALSQQQSVRYGGVVLDADRAIVSISPELFLAQSGSLIRTRPMKGTAPRQDASGHANPADSVNTPKNRAENLMIVDLLRNDLARLRDSAGRQPQVTVTDLFAIEAYPTVWQMVSEVEARFPDQAAIKPADLLQALFPCGSITGAPKVRAMQIIQEVEGSARGIYTGSLGWFAPNGDCRLNVAIRTLQLEPDGPAWGAGVMGVGGGIVSDSVAHDEWQECWHKARFLTHLETPFRLLETLRLEVGVGRFIYPHLAQHLARLGRSLQALGFADCRSEAEAALAEQAGRLEPGTWRVRLAVGLQGQVEVQYAPLLPEPDGPRWVKIAEQQIDADHPLRGHKTTVRAEYDAALADLSVDPACFDVLFFNQRNELVEGARSTVLLQLRGEWVTPARVSGCLPGVWRGRVLAGEEPAFPRVREAVLSRADLAAAEQVVCGNALRGWVVVSLVPAASVVA